MKNICVAVLTIVIGSWLVPTGSAQSSRNLDWLTQEEQDWLADHPLIRIAPTPDYPPFESWDEKGRFQGIVASYLDHFASQLGIKFEIVRTEQWEENLAMLKEREIDSVSIIVMSTDRDFVTVSKPYISYPAMLFVRKNEPRNLTLQDLAGKKVAVPNDYTGEFFLRDEHPEIEVVEAEDPAHGIRLLSQGKVEAFFGGLSVVNFIVERDGITNIRVASPTNFEYANGFGVRSDWEIFAGIISKTLDRTTAAQHGAFYAKWLSHGFTQKRFYQHAQFWWIIGSILGVMFFGIAAAVAWNRKQAAFIGQLEAAKILTEEANLKLDQLRRDAEAASDAKSSFVANISHEIRTPMNGVLGMCELLRGTGLDAQQHEYLDFATRSAENLLSLINDILDFSKIEAGKLEIEERVFSMDKLMTEVIGLMKMQAIPKNLQIIEYRDPEIDDCYTGDALRIRQILLNLISNAIKFTEQGEIHVRVLPATNPAASPRPGTRLIRFEVEDTGIGIAADKLDHIFQPFEQEDASTTRRFGGTGLGLAICKTLAEMMGGTADAKSEHGSGSLFGFTALLTQTTEEATSSEDSCITYISQGRRVLLAEDGLINQRVAIGLLEKRGHYVDLVENGQLALDALEENSYDVVLMDIQMPVMDGLAAVKEIRRREAGTDQHQWVVAMTAHAMIGDKEKFLKAGMDNHLTKPFKPEELYAAVERISKRQIRNAGPAGLSGNKSPV